MKKTMKLLKGLFILFVTISLVACNNDDDGTPPQTTNTIADFVVANSDNYSILLAALQRADGDLVNVLSGAGPFTVFAPNDAAFNTFLSANGFSNIDEVPTAVLSQILLNHVVAGKVMSTDLSNGYYATSSTATPNGDAMSLYVSIDGGVTLNGVSSVTAADNEVDNGVVHLVDAVIGLPTVVTFATADTTFGTLVAALTRTDIASDPNFVGVLSTPDGTQPAPFTVFAPTNDAFGALLTELEASSLEDIGRETLITTLQHHVVGGANVRAEDITDGTSTITTLGGDITSNKTGNAVVLTDANERNVNVVVVNIQAANGVIHVIDRVILPPL